ncbi:hypothetical protein ACWCY6_28290 [Streptomyces sp. 900105755]
MDELFAGYANYASTEAILEEQLTAAAEAGPDSSVSLSVTLSVTYSWSWTW